MRDPDGSVVFTSTRVRRHLTPGVESAHFLSTALARLLVAEGRLVDYEVQDALTLESPRLPFVSLPGEWCDSQLHQAARLTLELAERVRAAGLELKDASAANVIFDGLRPVFCDHLSFVPIRQRQWWAMGQFARHFIFPLLLAQRTGVHAHRWLQWGLDGIAPEDARRLLGPRRFTSLAWPMMVGATGAAPGRVGLAPLRPGQTPYHSSLITYCTWCLPRPQARARSAWSAYTRNRDHYTDNAQARKQALVSRWLAHAAARWVVDLGCNTGEYTRLAVATGAQVIAIDADHDCVAELAASMPPAGVYPVIANPADLSAGSGWLGIERPGLLARLRGRAELVLCLGLLHHLLTTEGVALDRIAEFLTGLCERVLVLELIAPEDPMAQRLMAQRNRRDTFPTLAQQRAALEGGFSLLERGAIGATRELVLLERRE